MLCWGAEPEPDSGEWFGDLPRGGKKQRSSKKKSRSQKGVSTMPSVPEEPSESDETVLTSDENALGSDARPEDPQSSQAISSPSPPKIGAIGRRSSMSAVNSKKKKKIKRQPKVKLTFVNGQFVDLSTKAGRELVNATSSEGATSAVGGIVGSTRSGHHGLSAPDQENAEKGGSDSKRSKLMSKIKRNSSSGSGGGSISNIRSKSDVSVASASSLESSASATSSVGSSRDASTLGSNGVGGNAKDAVSSIVALGEGRFLTASASDRVFKMWGVEKNAAGKPEIRFVRDFAGHETGITCLKKVDKKGRILSASKDRTMKLWDTRFNVDDGDQADAQRYLLATFDNMDRRKIEAIAVVKCGKFVRPTDKVDKAMATAMMKKAMKEGSGAVQKAAQERHIIECSCEFATISRRHNVVKMWSISHIAPEDGQHPLDGHNVAEVKPLQDLKHDAVVESITAAAGKGMLLTGDRMGHVRLWTSGKNVFLPGSAQGWSCVRTFSWRLKSELARTDAAYQFALTSLTFLQGNAMFVSGSKSGNLRVWTVDGTETRGETVKKELICITGAHTKAITSVQQGPQVYGGDCSNLSFSSASEDGKVLSFAIPVSKIGSCNPSCFNVVNHGIANRYFVDAEPIGVNALGCLQMPNKARDILVTGSTNNGSLNLLKRTGTPKQGPQADALLLYRQAMEEESIMLHTIAENLRNAEAVESRNRKLNMRTYKKVFRGSDAVSFLVEEGYAASRNDAVDLGHVLATHLSLFECVTKKCKGVEDDAKAYYRWSPGGSSKFDRKPSFSQSVGAI